MCAITICLGFLRLLPAVHPIRPLSAFVRFDLLERLVQVVSAYNFLKPSFLRLVSLGVVVPWGSLISATSDEFLLRLFLSIR